MLLKKFVSVPAIRRYFDRKEEEDAEILRLCAERAKFWRAAIPDDVYEEQYRMTGIRHSAVYWENIVAAGRVDWYLRKLYRTGGLAIFRITDQPASCKE